MSSTFTKVAAVAASTALVISGAQVAQAQDGQGGTGSLSAYGLSRASGSLQQPVNNTGTGSLDTTNSSLGEPTTGSLSGLLAGAEGSANFSQPGVGTGSVDTTNSSLGEPTTGSLSGAVGSLHEILGTGLGITTILGSSDGIPTGSLAALPGGGSVQNIVVNITGSTGGGSTSMLLPIVLVGGSVAAAVAAGPAIQQALANAHISIPSLPPLPNIMPKPAPGPATPNGRG